MSYQSVPIPEEHVPAVYELLASLSRGTTRPTSPGGGGEPDDGELSTLVCDVMEDTRTVFKTLARMPETGIGYDDLERKAGVKNLGAALQSLGIQAGKLGMAKPIKAHRRDGRYVYSMSAAMAERILRILDGGA